MKLVPESLNEVNFERGKDPRETMNIGRWAEKEMTEIFDFIVKRHKGTYEINYKGQMLEGFYKNELFGSGGRYFVYELDTGRMYMTWPGAGDIEIDMQHPDEFLNEVDKDLTSREESVKKLGYNPYRNGEYAISRP